MDILIAIHDLPLWVGAAIALVVYVGIQAIPAFKSLAPLFAALVLFTAAIGAIKRSSKRHLVDRQTGLDSVRRLTWQEFEHLVGEAYRRRGYDLEDTSNGADGGVDLILRRDGETTLVQCKHWNSSIVGVRPVRELAGVVAVRGATRGILVTLGDPTDNARRFASEAGIELVARNNLLRLIGISSPVMSQPIRAEAAVPTCPFCGSYMVRRTASRGRHRGKNFFGCSRYPKCLGKRGAE